MPKPKTPKSEKPPAEALTDQERIALWRQLRAKQGSFQKPKAGKKESK